MLQCPKCGRTYETDTQKFCTHDGGRLTPYDRASAPTSYDLNQTVRTDPFDPEATVTRMPDLGKTIASAPTSEIRPKETGPAAAPQPPPPPARQPEPPPQTPPQAPREMMPTVAFNQPPPAPPPPQQQYYAPQQPPTSSQATSAPTTPPAVQDPYAQMQPQYAPAPPQPYQQPQHPAPSRKSSRAPLIVGLVVLVLLGGLAAWYFLVYKKGEAGAAGNTNANANTAANTNTNANTGANTNANTTANANASSTPVPPGAGETQFINTSANLDGKLAENYSDFSFNYPSGWEKDPKAGVAGASNFVKVERRLPPDFTQENFAVSWYESTGTYESDERGDVFQKLVASWKSRLSKNFPEFEALADGPTTVNGIKGYELRFQSVSRGTEKGDITLWGRVVFLPPGTEGKKNGTQLLMLTTSLAPELTSSEDVGVKGQLPVILNSFKMGSK